MASNDQQLEEIVKALQLTSVVHDGSDTSAADAMANSTWKTSLYGKVLNSDKKVRFKTLQSTLFASWAKFGVISIANIRDDIFMAQFSTSKNLRRVLEDGPWTFQSDFMVLQKLVPGWSISDYKFDKLDIWIQLHNIPQDLLAPSVITNLLYGFGKVYPIDPLAALNWKSFARVKVEINTSITLKAQARSRLHNGNFIVADIKYERLSRYCNVCCRMGHKALTCRTRKRILEAAHNCSSDELKVHLLDSIKPKITDSILCRLLRVQVNSTTQVYSTTTPNVEASLYGTAYSAQQSIVYDGRQKGKSSTVPDEGMLDELDEHVESIDMANDLHTIGGLVPLLAYLKNPNAGIRAKAADVVTTIVQNNPRSQQLVMEASGFEPLLSNFTSDPDVTVRAKALGAISSLIRNNKPGIAAFRLANGYGALRDALGSENIRFQRKALHLIQYLLNENEADCGIVTELGFPRMIVHLASSDDSDVREAALEALLELARYRTSEDEGNKLGDDDKLRQLLQKRIEGVTLMAPDELGPVRDERRLLDSLWNECYSEPSLLREKGLVVLPGDYYMEMPPDVAGNVLVSPLRASASLAPASGSSNRTSDKEDKPPLLLGRGPATDRH